MLKMSYRILGLALITLALLGVKSAHAQDSDTLVVEWLDGNNILKNSLFDAISGDTTSTGERANPDRVYKLRQGGFYYITEAIYNTGFHLNIAGEKGDPSDPYANPPMLQVDIREDGSYTGKMFEVQGDLTLKNVILNGKTTSGALPYEIVNVTKKNGRYIFDNVIFEYAGWGIVGFYSENSDIFFTNCSFRNLLNETALWGGRGFSVWNGADTVWVENNSFTNLGGFATQIESSSANLLMFNHNTVVNCGRQVVLAPWGKDIIVTNNLFLNPFWNGEDPNRPTEMSEERLNSDDNKLGSIVDFQKLPADYGLDLERKILVSHNVFYTQQPFNQYFEDFNVNKMPIINLRARNLVDSYDNMIVEGNYYDTEDPMFTTYPENLDEALAFIKDVRTDVDAPALYYWDPNREDSNESIQWPLPEDLTYSNAAYKTAGYNNTPLGDLNWYPEAKAAWENNKQAEYDAIYNEFSGEEVVVTYVGAFEAESGTYSGDATTKVMDDKSAVRFESTGTATWKPTFSEGTYELVVKCRTWWADTAPDRPTNLVVNGNSQQFVYGINGPAWNDVSVTGITLNEGENTISLVVSDWGYMEYESITVKDNSGEVVTTLYAVDAELTDCRLYGDGFLASNDRIGNLTGGGIEIPFDVTEAGNYTMKIATTVIGGGSGTVDISVNGSPVKTAATVTSADKVWSDISINTELNTGANTITIDNVVGAIGVDKVDLYIVTTTGTSVDDNELPESFNLSQNYPNPFNPTTTISYDVPQAGQVQLDVFNILGAKVATLVNRNVSAGTHNVQFNAASLASGVYIYRLKFNDRVTHRRMTLIK